MDTRADKQIFEANFTNATVFANNGGTLHGSTLENGKLRTTAVNDYRAEYPKPSDVDAFFTNGGVLAFDLTPVTQPAAFSALGHFSKDTDYFVNLTYRGGTFNRVYVDLKNGSMTDFYTVRIPLLVLNKEQRITIVWDLENTNLSIYLDGVLAHENNVAGGPTIGTYPNSTGVLVGGFDVARVSMDSIIDNFVIYGDVWTDEDVEKDSLKTTFTETDIDANTPVWSDLNDKYSDGSNIVTTNKGTASNGIMGDGAGNNEPVLLEDSNGMQIDTTQYMTFGNVVLDNTKDWTMFYGLNPDDIDTAITHYNILLGVYQTDGFLINQIGSTLYFYWNSAAPSWSGLTTFFQKGFHSICLSSNGGIVSAYVDAKLIGTADLSAGGAFDGTYDLMIGNITASTEAKFYNPVFKDIALSARQIREMHQKLLNSIN